MSATRNHCDHPSGKKNERTFWFFPFDFKMSVSVVRIVVNIHANEFWDPKPGLIKSGV